VATYPAIAAASQAMLGLLESAAPASEFAGTDFKLVSATDLQTAPTATRISLYLYSVTVNITRRNLPPRIDSVGRRFRPSVPLDLHYLLIAWAKDVAKQQRLLGWAVRTIEDTPILPAGLLNHYGPEPDVFGPSDTVELIWEPLSHQDVFDIWEVARANQQPSASYVARIILIDSTVEIPDAPAVQTTEFDYAGGPAP